VSPELGQRIAAPRPLIDADSSPFWRSIKRGVLELARCQRCRRWEHPALERCRACDAPTTYEAISGRGRLHSWTVIYRAAVPGHEAPYVVAVVELEEQSDLRLAGCLIDAQRIALRMGTRVIAEVTDVDGTGYDAPSWRLVE
jgi:uncharacterized OB-fold protein